MSTIIHSTHGKSNGLTFAILDARSPSVSAMLGAPVALGLFTLDEFALPALRLTSWPSSFPFGTHVRSFANHLAYGAALAVAYRGLTHLGSDIA
ncbi:MAG: hypothetical protein NVSMB64_04220 [Candidatus Velthaea sp.]